MKRLWKSITLFAIANIIALTAPANADSSLEGIAIAAIYSGLCKANPFTPKALATMLALSESYPEHERLYVRVKIWGQIKTIGETRWCAEATNSPVLQRAFRNINESADKL